jgi:tripartite-type tricarboxylate transporter receptor subunit TctC
VLKTKEVRDAFAVQGTEIVGSTPEIAAKTFKIDVDKNSKLVKDAGLKFE